MLLLLNIYIAVILGVLSRTEAIFLNPSFGGLQAETEQKVVHFIQHRRYHVHYYKVHGRPACQ